MNRLKILLKHYNFKNFQISQASLPVFYDSPGATEAFLLIHGYTGYPSELKFIAQTLVTQGYAVYVLRLPGHGTNKEDFHASFAEDWLRHCFDSYINLKIKYKTVHVAGHSMGGLLATATAVTFNAPKLILLAPAFILDTHTFFFRSFRSIFQPLNKKEKPLGFISQDFPERRELHEEYWKTEHKKQLMQLLKLKRYCKKIISKVSSDVLLIVGEKDMTVSPKVDALFQKKAKKAHSYTSQIIKDASHCFTFDGHENDAISIIKKWLTN